MMRKEKENKQARLWRLIFKGKICTGASSDWARINSSPGGLVRGQRGRPEMEGRANFLGLNRSSDMSQAPM